MTEEGYVCPECGHALVGLDTYAHALVHWPEVLDPAKSSKEARSRQKLLLAGGVPLTVYQQLHVTEE